MNAEGAQWFVVPLETVEKAICARQTSPSASRALARSPGGDATRSASTMGEHRMQWNDSVLIDQIIAGTKTATVRPLEWSEGLDSYNTSIHCGAVYTVYDAERTPRCRIRITGVELCTWGAIPDSLWQRDPAADGRVSLEAFRADHYDYFGRPSDDHEFLAIYFQPVS